MKILITGASGCVGRYLVEALLANPDHLNDVTAEIADRASSVRRKAKIGRRTGDRVGAIRRVDDEAAIAVDGDDGQRGGPRGHGRLDLQPRQRWL